MSVRMSFSVDTKEFTKLLTEAQQKQVPYAISLALNETAKAGQVAIRGTLDDRFTVRRKTFIERTIKIQKGDFATKRRQAVRVMVDPTRDVLAKFEASTSKVPTGGRSMLAVPIEARGSEGQVIPKRLRIAALKLKPVSRRDRFKAGLRRLAPGMRLKNAIGEPRIEGLQRTFMAGGMILQNQGRGKNERIRVLYALKPRVKIRPVLGFVRTMGRTIDRTWASNFSAAFTKAMATRKPKLPTPTTDA